MRACVWVWVCMCVCVCGGLRVCKCVGARTDVKCMLVYSCGHENSN